MSVIVGSARIDENGNAYGGQAGDQTGREVMTQPWYAHPKGWVVLRPKSPIHASAIAANMEAACKNPNIGYDQWQRNSLYNAVKPLGVDVSRLKEKKETDCSALVRVCCEYAGIPVPTPFRTGEQVAVLMGTGAFTTLAAGKYTASSEYLKRGDILVTAKPGHTVVVLTDGSKAAQEAALPELSRGIRGEAVERLQRLLIAWNAKALPKYGADGDFGSETLKWVREYQKSSGLVVDGIVGAKTWGALGKYD